MKDAQKPTYLPAKLQIVVFESCDIITASGGGDSVYVPDVNEDGDW